MAAALRAGRRQTESAGRALKLHIIAVGHRPPAWISDGLQDYVRRMPRELPVVLTDIRPAARGPGAVATERILAIERDRILAAIPSGSVKVALDERGKAMTTKEFAGWLDGRKGQGRDVCFMIGGADGLAPELKSDADLVLSLSALTMPHALARVVLTEQLYRAVSIIRNHPYHRE